MVHDQQTIVETIMQLAEEIARTSPESAERAMQIIKLLRDLDAVQPDRATIQDAIEAETDTDLSDLKLRSTTEAVVRTMRGEG